MSSQIARWVLMPAIASVLCFAVRSAVFSQETPAKLTEKPVKSFGKVEDARGDVVISPNGERLAYLVRKENGSWAVVCDGREGMPYREVLGKRLLFSPDGKHFAYLADNVREHVFVCDGAAKPAWIHTGPVFSPDGRHVAYEGLEGRVQRDGRPDGDQEFRGKTLVFSPDSQHLAYLSGYPRHVVCDGKNGPPHKEGVLGDPVFAPNGKSYAHTVSQGEKIGDKWVAFWKDKKVGGPYDMVEGITLSPDSKRIAYRALVKDEWSVMVNDKKGPAFSQLGAIIFSNDGKHMAYRACDKEGWCVVLDGKKGLTCTGVGDPVFAADGKHLAYRAVKDGKSLVVCDDRESASFDEITWVGFTPDSNHLAFAAARGNVRLVVCDGIEGPAREGLMMPERPFDAPSKLRYVVIDKGEASLVEADWPADRTWDSALRPAAK